MVDVLTPELRRKCMQSIRSKNTKPELVVRSICHNLGYRFRLHRADLPGSPDIVFPKLRLCIFVHGCFWHRHPGCRFSTVPKTRYEFWMNKFTKNVERDARVAKALAELGWRAESVWECEIRDMDVLVGRLNNVLRACQSG